MKILLQSPVLYSAYMCTMSITVGPLSYMYLVTALTSFILKYRPMSTDRYNVFQYNRLNCYVKKRQEAQLLLGDRATRKHAKDS